MLTKIFCLQKYFSNLAIELIIIAMDKYEQIATWIKEIEEMQGSKIDVNNDTPSSTTFNSDNNITVISIGGMTLYAVYYYIEDEYERAKRRFEKEASMQQFDFNKFKKLY